MSIVDPQLILATPALFVPSMNTEEWEQELTFMFDRSMATHDFLDGKITPDEFEQALDQFGVDPWQAAQDWENGRSYL